MMRSATAFLPDSMMTFMNLDRSTEPNFGSGRISRLGTSRRRGISFFLWLQLARAFALASGTTNIWGHPLTRQATLLADLCRPSGRSFLLAQRASGLLRALGAVLGTRLLAVFDALQVERSAHDVIAHTRQILHPAAAHQHHTVLLKVVTLAADVGNDFEPVGQANLGHFAQRRVRLLRGGGVHAGTHATTLRATLQRWRFGLRDLGLATVTHELVDGRHLVTCSRLKSLGFRRNQRLRGRTSPKPQSNPRWAARQRAQQNLPKSPRLYSGVPPAATQRRGKALQCHRLIPRRTLILLSPTRPSPRRL